VAYDTFFVLLGIPRSGTTITGAILEAHPEVELFFEPFNAYFHESSRLFDTPEAFAEEFLRRSGQRRKPGAVHVGGFKEVSERPEGLHWAKELLTRFHAQVPVKVLLIVRDPVHTYLSRVEGARKWWGYPDAQPTEKRFVAYVNGMVKSYQLFDEMLTAFGGLVFSYKGLVETPEQVLPELMGYLGVTYQPEQMEYFKLKRPKGLIKGDYDVATEPKPISTASLANRQREAEEFLGSIGMNRERFGRLFGFVDQVDERKVIRMEPGEHLSLVEQGR
jgi:hypothetical protein